MASISRPKEQAVTNDAAEQQQINEKLEAYLSRKLKDNWFCTPEEEIDFEGLANYIRENLVSIYGGRL